MGVEILLEFTFIIDKAQNQRTLSQIIRTKIRFRKLPKSLSIPQIPNLSVVLMKKIISSLFLIEFYDFCVSIMVLFVYCSQNNVLKIFADEMKHRLVLKIFGRKFSALNFSPTKIFALKVSRVVIGVERCGFHQCV